MSAVYDPRTAVVVVDGVTLSVTREQVAERIRAAVEGGRFDPSAPPHFGIDFTGIVGARLVPPRRGCFHEACIPLRFPGEGGTHWCTMGDGR